MAEPKTLKDMTEIRCRTFSWWEKSVEYQFIADAIRFDAFSLLAPLDGDEERVGDAIFAKNAKFIVVEFKRSLNDFSSEYRKYKTVDDETGKLTFGKASVALSGTNEGNHHLLVSGELCLDPKPSLIVKFYKYFSCGGCNPISLKNDGFQVVALGGMEKDDFDKYVLELSKFKGNIDEADSEQQGSGFKGLQAEAIVIGISPKKHATVVTLTDYTNTLKLTLSDRNRIKTKFKI